MMASVLDSFQKKRWNPATKTRNYREFLIRKCGHVVNLTDTFNRLFERSDSMVAEMVRQSLAKHSRQIRPKISVLTEEDAIVESILASD